MLTTVSDGVRKDCWLGGAVRQQERRYGWKIKLWQMTPWNSFSYCGEERDGPLKKRIHPTLLSIFSLSGPREYRTHTFSILKWENSRFHKGKTKKSSEANVCICMWKEQQHSQPQRLLQPANTQRYLCWSCRTGVPYVRAALELENR